jgi:hypothetical protein
MEKLLLETKAGKVCVGAPLTSVSEGWHANVDTTAEYASVFALQLEEAFTGKPRFGASTAAGITVIHEDRQFFIEGKVDGTLFNLQKNGKKAASAKFRMRLKDGSFVDVTLDSSTNSFTAKHGINRQMRIVP